AFDSKLVDSFKAYQGRLATKSNLERKVVDAEMRCQSHMEKLETLSKYLLVNRRSMTIAIALKRAAIQDKAYAVRRLGVLLKSQNDYNQFMASRKPPSVAPSDDTVPDQSVHFMPPKQALEQLLGAVQANTQRLEALSSENLSEEVQKAQVAAIATVAGGIKDHATKHIELHRNIQDLEQEVDGTKKRLDGALDQLVAHGLERNPSLQPEDVRQRIIAAVRQSSETGARPMLSEALARCEPEQEVAPMLREEEGVLGSVEEGLLETVRGMREIRAAIDSLIEEVGKAEAIQRSYSVSKGSVLA
ncbi:hypothetical protein EV182_001457, partial [Spiromyces aspiralis]